jgi:hypothetical protein
MTIQVESQTETVRRKLKTAIFNTVDEIGGRAEDSLTTRLNEAYPPASSSGESPHRRTGNLRAGAAHLSEQTDTGAMVTVFITRAGDDPLIPVYLEFGTDRMDERPFMRPERDYWFVAARTELPVIYLEKLTDVVR